MPGCAVPPCKYHTNWKTREKNVILHSFPREDALAAEWWQKIRRLADQSSVKDKRVCSLHFTERDYQRDLQWELLNPEKSPMQNPRRSLMPTAVPSLHIEAESELASSGTAGLQKRSRKKLAAAALEVSTVEPQATSGEQVQHPEKEDVESLQLQIDLLKSELSELRRSCAYSAAAKNGLFTEQQAKFLIYGVRPCPWDDETNLKALDLRLNSSRKTYEWLLRDGQPLPSLDTLQRWLSTIQLRAENADQQLRMLRKLLAPLSERDRQCIVMFDEMDLMGRASYDAALDQVIGPHKHLQVFMAAGIFKKWRMPVLFAYDQAVTGQMLRGLIAEMEKSGAYVVATVNDMGGSNQGLWKELGISHRGETSFANPVDEKRRIWCFADAPHLFKRLRSNILDGGLRTSRKGLVDRDLMRRLVAIDGNSQFKILHKISLHTHVEVTGMARQKVRPAYQLISASCALAMERYLKDTAEPVRVLRLFDAVGDVLNAGNPCDNKPLRRGYDGSDEQEDILQEAARELTEMRIGKAKHLYAFQKGWLVSIKSVRGLLADMKSKFGPQTYLLTRRLTQDQLESMFGVVRGRGGSNWNPTALEAKGRLRLITLQYVRQAGQNPMAPDPEEPTEEPTVREMPRGDVGDGLEDEDGSVTGDDVQDLQEEVSRSELQSLGTEPGEAIEADLAAFATLQNEPDADPEVVDNEEEAELLELLQMEEQRSSQSGATTAPVQGASDIATGVPAARSAMAYVAGAVARKCQKYGGPLSARAEEVPREALWTQLLSMGGLTIPSEAFLNLFSAMEREFCLYHAHEPDQLSRKEGVVRQMTELLVDKLSVSQPVAKKFARVRTFIRMQCLNVAQQLEAMEKRAKRKRRHHSQ